MTVRNEGALKAELARLFGDNNSEDITPADLRRFMVDIVDTLFDAVAEDEGEDDEFDPEDYQLKADALTFLPVLGPVDVTPSTKQFASTGLTDWEDKTFIVFSLGEAPTTSVTVQFPNFNCVWIFVADLLEKDTASVGDRIAENPYTNSLVVHPDVRRRSNPGEEFYVGRTANGEVLIAAIDTENGIEKMRITAL